MVPVSRLAKTHSAVQPGGAQIVLQDPQGGRFFALVDRVLQKRRSVASVLKGRDHVQIFDQAAGDGNDANGHAVHKHEHIRSVIHFALQVGFLPFRCVKRHKLRRAEGLVGFPPRYGMNARRVTDICAVCLDDRVLIRVCHFVNDFLRHILSEMIVDHGIGEGLAQAVTG